MKRVVLSVGAAIVVSFAASAANWNWFSYGSLGSSAGTVYADATTPLYDKIGPASIYLIDAAVKSQTALLSEIRGAESASTYWGSVSKVDTTSLNDDSQIDDKIASYGTAGQSYSFYYAIFNDSQNQLLLTDSLTRLAEDMSEVDLDFTTASAASKNVFGTAAYGSAGWYTASVPEPFSGTLALLGMVGLGLRRKLKKQKQA